MSESVKKEQIIYTWEIRCRNRLAAMEKVGGRGKKKSIAPGVYILKDGIYYLGVYETEDKK